MLAAHFRSLINLHIKGFGTLICFAINNNCIKTFKQLQLRYISYWKKNHPFDIDTTTMQHDILVYSCQDVRLYKHLSIIGGGQFIVWVYLSIFSFVYLKDSPGTVLQSDSSWLKKVTSIKDKYTKGISILCFLMGKINFYI